MNPDNRKIIVRILAGFLILGGLYCIWTVVTNPATISVLESFEWGDTGKSGRNTGIGGIIFNLLMGICLIFFGVLIIWPEKSLKGRS